jgi:NAD(P)-dependent dehydrogenase (short-subunit alcohol dehydrogenase family)
MRTDRIVVITGAAGGMGSLLVRRFLTNGDTVNPTDTADEGLHKLRYAQARRQASYRRQRHLERGRLRESRRSCRVHRGASRRAH